MNKYIKCINYLVSKKTGQVSHYKKNLFQHLINVYNKLREWGCEEDVCYAGLFHSIYGNESFKEQIENDRNIIKNLIGEKAENLVYLYNKDRHQNKNLKIISLANELDHDYIHVIDNYFDKLDIDKHYFYFRDQISWNFTGSGLDKFKWRKFIYYLNFNNDIEKNLKKQTYNILKNMNVHDLLKVERIYASANPYGTVHDPHKDYNQELNSKGGITVMYYLNNFWNFKFGGETVFLNSNNQDILKSVIPKPGRVVVFDGNIEHCARDIRRDVNDLRMVLTFKFKISIN